MLAQVWGPVLLAVGLGIFVSREYYNKIYRDLEKETLAVLIFGMVGMAAGIIHIALHNTWGTLPEVVVSFISWGLLAKGALFLIAPRVVDRAGDWWAADSKRITIAGALTVIVGAYLSWIGYLA